VTETIDTETIDAEASAGPTTASPTAHSTPATRAWAPGCWYGSRPAGTPRLSIGLPVYNGERYLAEALDALLTQTFSDFEILISDNASTDRTADICAGYAERDPRIRWYRQPVNLGAAANHHFVVRHARGAYFKWASHDDLYAPDLLRRCVEALDERSGIVLAHAWEAFIDEHGNVIQEVRYPLATDSPDPVVRFASLLNTSGGDDFYGVMRTDVLRTVRRQDSYHNSDRTLMAEVALHGPFHQVPEVLYFRRDHPDRGERAPSVRARAAVLDPRRADPLRHPVVRLFTEYVAGFVSAVSRSPLSTTQKVRCLSRLAFWLLMRLTIRRSQHLQDSPDPAIRAKAASRVLRKRSRSRAER
jgi:glycosyltransferase involved in cell wall biosynthesis